jgi:glycosyltransferase involved in cell wall biosynthesis
MESMACGTPCVGFDTGGIPEMIDHLQNGYVAQYKDTEDLAKGIVWVLESNHLSLSNHAVEKVKTNYTETVIAKKYTELYYNLLNKNQ